ncbi:MAG: DNA polymerase III subunit delta [Clostridia bacterium]
MKALEFKRKMSEGIANIYSIVGNDSYLKSYVVGVLLATIPDEDMDFCYSALDENCSVSEILDSVGTMSFVQSRKFVVVKNWEKELTKDEKARLVDYADDPSENCSLILIDSPKIASVFGEKSVTVDCNKAVEDDIISYIAFLLKKRNCSMDKFGAKLIIASCNGDLGKIEREVEKLMLFCNGESNITQADVELLTPPDTEFKIFELTNAIQKENFSQALSILNTLIARGEKPLVILATITASYRKMFVVANSTASDEQLQQVLGFSPNALKMNKSIVDQNKKKNPLYIPQLKRTLDYFYDLEFAFKSGKISQESALDLAIAKLVSQKK